MRKTPDFRPATESTLILQSRPAGTGAYGKTQKRINETAGNKISAAFLFHSRKALHFVLTQFFDEIKNGGKFLTITSRLDILI